MKNLNNLFPLDLTVIYLLAGTRYHYAICMQTTFAAHSKAYRCNDYHLFTTQPSFRSFNEPDRCHCYSVIFLFSHLQFAYVSEKRKSPFPLSSSQCDKIPYLLAFVAFIENFVVGKQTTTPFIHGGEIDANILSTLDWMDFTSLLWSKRKSARHVNWRYR